jgi:hypothetical protein
LLGPDWGLCVTAGDKGTWCPRIVAALRVQSGPGAEETRRNLLSFLDGVANLAMLFAGKNDPAASLEFKTEQRDGVELRYLTGSKTWPAGLEPAYALKDGYLLVASSPEAIHAFHVPAGKTAGRSSDEVPLLRISVSAWSGFLRSKREALSHWIAEATAVPAHEAAARLDAVLSVLDLFTTVDLMQTTGPGRVGVILRLRTAQALRD